MKVCLNIDGVFELFEIVLANFHDTYSQKSEQKLLYFYPFYVFEEKDHGTMSVMARCIIYFNTVGLMQSKLKELLLLTFFERFYVNFYPFLFLNKILISNQWKIIRF